MRKIDEKFKRYVKDKESWYSPYEGFSMHDLKSAYEAGYRQAVEEVGSIWQRPKNVWNWLIARSKEGLIYLSER
jgi:hypothetical protein